MAASKPVRPRSRTDIAWLNKDHHWPGLAVPQGRAPPRNRPGKTTSLYRLLSAQRAFFHAQTLQRSRRCIGASKIACTGGSMSS